MSPSASKRVLSPAQRMALRMKAIYYAKRAPEYVRRELGWTPSPDQVRLLEDFSDLSNLNFIISAGRGAGKTIAVSWLVSWSLAVLPDVLGRKYEIKILGGSGEQSKIMYDHFKDNIYKTNTLELRLVGEPRARETKFDSKSSAKALMASKTSVRGPHPDLLIIDEVCEADDRIVKAALPQVGEVGARLVMLSTPHKQFGPFKDYWDAADEVGFKRYGPWPLDRCPWIAPLKLEHWKITMSPDEYAAEVKGEFAKAKSAVFDPAWVDAAASHGTFAIRPGYRVLAGLDWGQVHPSVFTEIQYIEKNVLVPGPERVYEYVRYPEQSKEFLEIVKRDKVAVMSCDSSHIGENERLQDGGAPVEPVSFQEHKGALVEFLIMLLWNKRIWISKDHPRLIKGLKRYSKIETRGGREAFRKVEDDEVDSLLIALFPLYLEGLDTDYEVPRTII